MKTLHGIVFSFRISTLYNRFFINNCFSIRWQVIINICYVDVSIVVNCLCIVSFLKFWLFQLSNCSLCWSFYLVFLTSHLQLFLSHFLRHPTFVLVVLLKQNICEIKPRLRFFLNIGGCIYWFMRKQKIVCVNFWSYFVNKVKNILLIIVTK